MTQDAKGEVFDHFTTRSMSLAPYHGLCTVVLLGLALLATDKFTLALLQIGGYLFALSFAFHLLTLAATRLQGTGLKVFQATGALAFPIAISLWLRSQYGPATVAALVPWIQDGEVLVGLSILAFLSFGIGRQLAETQFPFRAFIVASVFLAFVAMLVSDGPRESRLLVYLVPVLINYIAMSVGLYIGPRSLRLRFPFP